MKEPNEDRPSKFTKKVQDSCIVWTINKNGSIITENQIGHTENTNKWILEDNKLYVQLNLEKELYSVNLLTMSESELQIKFLGYKNIYMPFLCGYELMDYPMNDNVFEYPTNDRARFGSTKDDFSKYINEKIKISDNTKEGTKCNVFIKTNCNGEVVEAKIIGKTIFANKNEFEKSILEAVEKMPKWNPATKRDLAKIEPINGGNRFTFTYQAGKVNIIEG
ncbi:MAG: hypothetical protein H0X46_06155 [Bacteroidetes bacterium]|nr:hypothetical protein [Bacteroidota bacterium]